MPSAVVTPAPAPGDIGCEGRGREAGRELAGARVPFPVVPVGRAEVAPSLGTRADVAAGAALRWFLPQEHLLTCLWSRGQAGRAGRTVPFHFPPVNTPRENKRQMTDMETPWEGPWQVFAGEEADAGLTEAPAAGAVCI